jgi:16S rRNA processing protein RimM
VLNRQGSRLGEVQSLQTNGAHDWLVLEAGMIPFVAQYIDQVDTQARRIDVDWDPEWWQ